MTLLFPPEVEAKRLVRRVRDVAYWGLPYGTPIVGEPELVNHYADLHLDYQPGRWQRVSMRAHVEAAFEDLKMTAEQYGYADEDDALWADAHRTVHEGGSYEEYRNGPHRIVVSTTKAVPVKEFLTQIEALLQAHPPSRTAVSLGIVPQSRMVGKDSLGETFGLGRHIFQISDEVLDTQPLTAEHTGQAAMTVHPLTWVLAHEWGHAHTTAFDQDEKEALFDRAMAAKVWAEENRYATKDIEEAYAQMFAEYWVTQGQTDNEIAQAYAAIFKWGQS